MRQKRKFKNSIIALVLLLSMFVLNLGTQEFQAASSYTNAMMFYESRTATHNRAVETVNGTIFYATKAKLASSSTNLRYHTLGFDITLIGNGQAVTFSVSRTGGSMVQISNVQYGGYDYILYAIQDQTLFNLAMAANPSVAPTVLDASSIYVYMSAIMTTKQGGALGGGVSETGTGGLYEWGKVYHLNNYAHLSTMMRTFSGHTFESYINIYDILKNYQLYVNYNVQGTPEANTNCSSTASVGNGYAISNGYLTQNGSQYMQSSRVLTAMTLVNPSNIALSKTGYHLEEGREWTALNRSFTHLQSYMPKSIHAGVGYQNCGITMYANWQPNKYTINYNANGGNGFVAASTHTYDVMESLRASTFTRTGYKLKLGEEWNTSSDGTGTSYSSSELVSNLTNENGGLITLYANWEPCIYSITEYKEDGVGGTDEFYEKYDTGFYLEEVCAPGTEISSIELPNKKGYDFLGYFDNIFGVGEPLIGPDANITFPNNYYTYNTTLYAGYKAKQFSVTFDKQGGYGGSDSAVVTYDQFMPIADAPVREGYTFTGYYTEPNGQGELYYNENMATSIIYQSESDLILYANWVDNTSPNVNLVATTEDWTKDEIVLTATGIDYGSGLASLQLYMNDALITDKANLAGVRSETITYTNTMEGVINYKAVATDMVGNQSEAFKTVKYDIKAPEGEIIECVVDEDGKLHIKIKVTDMNVQSSEGINDKE